MVQNEIKIAVIIPHYYNSQISKRAFDSLKYQTKKEHLVIYLINDCSPHTDCNYQDLIDEYSPYFSIQYFQTEINSGQGITRQLGLNNVIEDYILFLDQDDFLYDNYVIENYLNILQETQYDIIEGQEVIQIDNNQVEVDYNKEFFHASLYKTSFIKQHNINFIQQTSRVGEIYLFCLQCKHFNPTIKKIDKIIYVQHHSSDFATITWNKKYCFIMPEAEIFLIAEAIKFYQSCTQLSQEEKKYIYYKLLYCALESNNILMQLEQHHFNKYLLPYKEQCKQEWNFINNLIIQNQNILFQDRLPAVWKYFYNTFEERFSKL